MWIHNSCREIWNADSAFSKEIGRKYFDFQHFHFICCGFGCLFFFKAGVVQGEVLTQERVDLKSNLSSISDECSREQACSPLQGSAYPGAFYSNFRSKDRDLEWLYRASHNGAAPPFWGRALPMPVWSNGTPCCARKLKPGKAKAVPV